ncbi:hypothetical protein B0H11DRAFT_1107355 [Mycena galericulata]|nr:hypothetical protein B0H11DRAFT_1107355 [Mycena galericulata]
MSVSLSHCLKRLPLRSFPRFYASAAVALSQKTVAAEPESFEDVKIKKRTSRAKKPKVEVEVEPKPPPPPNILEWTSVQEHLEQISETNGQLVLADIERCQPPSHARPGTPTYEAQYNELRDKLTKSFNLKQLRKFLKLYEIAPLKKTKDECAVVIMEDQWNWPSLSAIRERERESEIDVETFPLTPSQAFIILGKDGEDSRALATKYHIRMTYLANPLSLRVEGMVGSLKKFSQHIVDLKEAISEDVFELPIDKPIRTELLQRVSRLSGALTENFGPRQIRVTFNRDNPRSALVAKRLAARAVCEGNGAKQPRLFFHLPPSVPSSSPVPTSTTYPHAYSLYPFLSPRALPWTVSASGVFRLRRVEEWLSTGASENLKKTGGLLMGRGRTVTLHQDDVDLRSLLLAGFSESPPSTSRIVVASLGHVLLTSPPSEQISLTPPLQGDWKLPHILNWMQERSEPTVFIPSLPVAVLNSEPARHRMLHRLIYHAVNTEGDANGGQKFIKVELELARAIKVTEPSNERPEAAFHATCFAGQDTELDIMMPDRRVIILPCHPSI